MSTHGQEVGQTLRPSFPSTPGGRTEVNKGLPLRRLVTAAGASDVPELVDNGILTSGLGHVVSPQLPESSGECLEGVSGPYSVSSRPGLGQHRLPPNFRGGYLSSSGRRLSGVRAGMDQRIRG